MQTLRPSFFTLKRLAGARAPVDLWDGPSTSAAMCKQVLPLDCRAAWWQSPQSTLVTLRTGAATVDILHWEGTLTFGGQRVLTCWLWHCNLLSVVFFSTSHLIIITFLLHFRCWSIVLSNPVLAWQVPTLNCILESWMFNIFIHYMISVCACMHACISMGMYSKISFWFYKIINLDSLILM